MFAFSGVLVREILMDLNDVEGDRNSKVWTLPVLLGKPAALCCAMAFLLAGSAGALFRLLTLYASLGEAGAAGAATGSTAGWPLLQQGMMRLGVAVDPAWAGAVTVAAPVLVLLMAVLKLARLAWGVWQNRFDEGVVGAAVDECLKPIGWGIILLAALA